MATVSNASTVQPGAAFPASSKPGKANKRLTWPCWGADTHPASKRPQIARNSLMRGIWLTLLRPGYGVPYGLSVILKLLCRLPSAQPPVNRWHQRFRQADNQRHRELGKPRH